MSSVIAYPTESVYGLGCDPFNATAVARILDLKQRSIDKGFIVIGSKIEHLLPFVNNPETAFTATVLASWPGPYTWICNAHPKLPGWISGYRSTVALRLTSHPIAKAICDEYNSAIISTSANKTGQRSARDALQTQLIFGNNLDVIIKGDTGGQDNPTEIRSAATGELMRLS